MCLIIVAYEPKNSKYQLVVTANREEYYNRPSLEATYWKENQILAGRDLEGGGTWLGMDRHRGRFAALTNNFLVATHDDNDRILRSRGELVTDFLKTSQTAETYLSQISVAKYRGFSLLVLDETGFFHLDNNATVAGSKPIITRLPPDHIYGLSNRTLNCDWPKNQRGRQELQKWLRQEEEQQQKKENYHGEKNKKNDHGGNDDSQHEKKKKIGNTKTAVPADKCTNGEHKRNVDKLHKILLHPYPPTKNNFPDHLAEEAFLMSTQHQYGTRVNTAITMDYKGNVTFSERGFGPPHGTPIHQSFFQFKVNQPREKD